MTEDGVEYKYVRVYEQGFKNNLKEMNELLEKGWTPVRECAFGGGYSNMNSVLVLIMRTIKKSDITITEVFDDKVNERKPEPKSYLSHFDT